jgi:hypothetical protein
MKASVANIAEILKAPLLHPLRLITVLPVRGAALEV